MSDITNNNRIPSQPAPAHGDGAITPVVGAPLPEEVIATGKTTKTEAYHDVMENSEGHLSRKTVAADGPQAFLPNAKGRQKAAVINDIKTGSIKGHEMTKMMTQEEIDDQEFDEIIEALRLPPEQRKGSNPWFKYPSAMGALYAALMTLQEKYSEIQVMEGENRITSQKLMFDTGMAAAEKQKQSTLMEAKKEFMDGVQKLAAGVQGALEIGAQAHSAGQIERQADADYGTLGTTDNKGKFTKGTGDIGAKEVEVNKARDDFDKRGAASKTDLEADPAYMKANSELTALKREKYSRISQDTRTQTELTSLTFRTTTNFVDSAFAMVKSGMTEQAAGLQKEKGVLDTLSQSYSKTEERISRAREEATGNMDKVFQLVAELSRSRASFSNRG